MYKSSPLHGGRAKEQRGVEPPAYFSGIYTCTTGLCCCSMYWLLQAFGAKAHKLVYGVLLSHKRYCNVMGKRKPLEPSGNRYLLFSDQAPEKTYVER